MKINREKLVKYLKDNNITMFDFVKNLGWSSIRFIDLLFNNGQLEREDAKDFIQLVGARDAMRIINWRKMNVRKPRYNEIFCTKNANYSAAI